MYVWRVSDCFHPPLSPPLPLSVSPGALLPLVSISRLPALPVVGCERTSLVTASQTVKSAKMSLSQQQQQPLPLSMRPLGQNNSQQPQPGGGKIKRSLASKITARADSTGLENEGPPLVKHHHSVKKQQTASVVKRNLRERTRVRGVNDGFGNLRLHVPDLKNKSSKVETLRGAIEYIKQLKELLGEDIQEFSIPPSTPREIKFEDDDGKIFQREESLIPHVSQLTFFSPQTPPPATPTWPRVPS